MRPCVIRQQRHRRGLGPRDLIQGPKYLPILFWVFLITVAILPPNPIPVVKDPMLSAWLGPMHYATDITQQLHNPTIPDPISNDRPNSGPRPSPQELPQAGTVSKVVSTTLAAQHFTAHNPNLWLRLEILTPRFAWAPGF